MNKHSCKTHRRNDSCTKRHQPQPSHTRGTFHRRLQPLYTEKHKVSCAGFLPTTLPMVNVLLHDLPPFIKVNFIASYSFVMYWYIMYCYMIYHPSSRSISLLLILLWCIDTLCFVTWPTTLHQGQFHCFLFFCDVLIHYVLLHDPPPFIKVNFIAAYSFVMHWYMRYCYMTHHPSSRSISLLLILLWCIDTLCIVTWPTTLHQGQFHCFLFFCDVLIHYVVLHDPPPFIIVKVIRNSEVLTFPTSFD